MCQSVNNAKIKTMYFESWDTKRIENGRFDRWIFQNRLQRLFDTLGFVVILEYDRHFSVKRSKNGRMKSHLDGVHFMCFGLITRVHLDRLWWNFDMELTLN